MNKPKNTCEIKLSKDDVAKAIELYLNQGKHYQDLEVFRVKASRSKNYLIIAEFE